MNFLLPAALLGLLTLPVILLLHLLRNRREQMTISSLRLWRGLQQQRGGTLPRHIPLSLMLLLQLIVATALTLALAQPVSSFVLGQPQHTTFIIDTTTSMTALASPGTFGVENAPTRFDQAKAQIEQHLQSLAQDDSVSIISLSPQPEIVMTGTGAQQAAMQLALKNLTPGATGANLSQALSLANGLVDPNRQNRIVLLTDGNTPVDPAALPTVLAPFDWQILPPTPAQAGNQALFDVSSRPMPDGRHRLFARVVNYSDASIERTLRLYVDGEAMRDDALQIEPQSDAVQTWTLPASAQTAAVEILEPDILPLDNRAELLLTRVGGYRVLLVSDLPDTLGRALSVQPGIELTTISPDDLPAQELSEFDLLAFDEPPLSQTSWPRNNVLIVNPPLGHPLLPAEGTGRTLRPNVDDASSLLTGVDLSGVYFNRAPQIDLPQWAQLDLLADAPPGESPLPLIFHGNPTSGSQAMVWAFDLADSNLPARLALPLLTANTLSTLLAPSPPAAISMGDPVLLAGNYTVEIPDGHRLFLDADNPDGVFTHTRLPGLYKIYSENDQLVAGFSVFAGSPQESNLSRQVQPDALAAITVSPVPPPLAEIDFEEFWPFLAVLAMGVVIFEGWLAWRR